MTRVMILCLTALPVATLAAPWFLPRQAAVMAEPAGPTAAVAPAAELPEPKPSDAVRRILDLAARHAQAREHAAALQAADRALAAAQSAMAHPYFWSAFFLIGDPKNLTLGAPRGRAASAYQTRQRSR